MNRVLMVLAASAAAAVVMVGCNNNGKCDASSCAGCCNADGQCVTGNTVSECGRRGESCSACTTGQSCATNACVAGMGGGGGTTGGGGGSTGGGGGTTGGGGGTTGGGGGQVTCTTVDFTAAAGAFDLGGQFQAGDGENAGFHTGAMGKPGTAQGTFDVLGVELWYLDAPTVTFPYPVTLNGTTYNTCESCVTLNTGCDGAGENCSKFFLGQMGTVNYTAGTQNEDQGEFRANGMNINLVEWEFTQSADRAVPNGRCVTVNFNMVATWEPEDAGVIDAGMTIDAGITTDAGTDAGVTTDAGTDAGLPIDAGLELDAGSLLDAGLELDAGVTMP